MFKCIICEKYKFFQSSTEYGICKLCDKALKVELKNINDFITETNYIPQDMSGYGILCEKIQNGLHKIEELKISIDKSPGLKSLLDGYASELKKNQEIALLELKEEKKKEQEEEERKIQEQKVKEAHEEAKRLLEKYGPQYNFFPVCLQDDSYREYLYQKVELVASEFISDLPLIESLNAGDPVTFQQEPGNLYDKKAVLVLHKGAAIGYLKKGNIQSICNDWIKKNKTISGKIYSIDPYEYKIVIDIAFYTNLFLKYANNDYFDCKLVRTSKNDEYGSRQDHLESAHKGQGLIIKEDSDWEQDETKYIVKSNKYCELGELSKRDAKKYEKLDETERLIPVLLEVNINENYTFGAIVRIYIL